MLRVLLLIAGASLRPETGLQAPFSQALSSDLASLAFGKEVNTLRRRPLGFASLVCELAVSVFVHKSCWSTTDQRSRGKRYRGVGVFRKEENGCHISGSSRSEHEVTGAARWETTCRWAWHAVFLGGEAGQVLQAWQDSAICLLTWLAPRSFEEDRLMELIVAECWGEPDMNAPFCHAHESLHFLTYC